MCDSPERDRTGEALVSGVDEHIARNADPADSRHVPDRSVEPRRNENTHGQPTRPPSQSFFDPRDGAPDPESVEREGVSQHWRKHPSDYHADIAVSHMGSAHGEADTLRRGQELQIAEIHSRLALRDAVLECSATLKEIASRQIESTSALDETVKKATNAVVVEIRKATLKEVA